MGSTLYFDDDACWTQATHTYEVEHIHTEFTNEEKGA
jgi:hypothetical protein